MCIIKYLILQDHKLILIGTECYIIRNNGHSNFQNMILLQRYLLESAKISWPLFITRLALKEISQI